MLAIAENVDRLITVDMRGYWKEGRGLTLKLYDIARKKYGEPLAMLAAKQLAENLNKGDTVFLSCGFIVPPLYPIGEICGPPGVIALARALSLGFGVKSVVVTEKVHIPVVKAVASAAALRVWEIDELNAMMPYRSIAIQEFPVEADAGRKQAIALIEKFRPKAVITVERPGANIKGIEHTGQGNDMSKFTARINILIEEAKNNGILTIGIGDLGNEIGWGAVKDEVAEILPLGKECKCGCGGGIVSAVETDILVVGAASNKGAYGIVACLAALTGDISVLHDGFQQKRLIEAAADAGAGDTFSVSNTLDEDGVPYIYQLRRKAPSFSQL